MADENGEGPVQLIAGHLVIYEGVVAFRADGSDDVVHPNLPPVLIPILVKLLSGGELELSDVPGGMLAKARAMMGRG